MEPFSGNTEKNLKKIKNTLLVMSGKGGVGKSTVAVNVARALNLEGMKVGILDIDIHGPSVSKMLNIENMKFGQTHDGFLVPVETGKNFYAASIAMMLDGDSSPVIWRGPMKSNFI
ncbi:MAG TPA: P-loop NTPase, partial [Candidatus Wallbacteria bacterium]|nr:P-loop NTPase [Candidatus Wallbacteria bacterium]